MNSEAPWYAIADLPLPRETVRFAWAGFLVIGWRTRHPKTKRVCYAVHVSGGDVAYWPPKNNQRNLPPEPDAWQPLDPETWPHALGVPLNVAPARFVDIRKVRRNHSNISSSSESSPTEVTAEERRGRWWRDGNAVRYEPAGKVSLDMAEARVLRAILTDGLRELKDGARRGQAWPQQLMDLQRAIELMSADPTKGFGQRFQPSPRDIDDSLVAMAWFARLDPPELRPKGRIRDDYTREQKLLIMRAIEPVYTWRQIGDGLGMSHEAARRAYGVAVERVWRAANGKKVFEHLAEVDQIAALKLRNREARSGA